MKILLACSSSGGHIYPAISLGEYLKNNNHEIAYVGFKNCMEERIITSDKIYLIDYPNSFKKALKNKHKKIFVKVIKELTKIIKKYDVVICFGGFITSLVSIGCILLNKRYYLHEQNIDLGDSNRLAYLGAKKVFRTFKKNNNKKEILVGNPSSDRFVLEEYKEHYNTSVLFIFGSLGSATLLEKVEEFINNTKLKNISITIVKGLKNNLKTTNLLQNTQNKVIFREFIDTCKEINNFDIVFTRGGATTLSELIKTSCYVVAIPSPYVKHNHQYNNSKFLYDLGLIDLVKESVFSSSLIEEKISLYLKNKSIRKTQYETRKKYELKNASKLIMETLINENKN